VPEHGVKQQSHQGEPLQSSAGTAAHTTPPLLMLVALASRLVIASRPPHQYASSGQQGPGIPGRRSPARVRPRRTLSESRPPPVDEGAIEVEHEGDLARGHPAVPKQFCDSSTVTGIGHAVNRHRRGPDFRKASPSGEAVPANAVTGMVATCMLCTSLAVTLIVGSALEARCRLAPSARLLDCRGQGNGRRWE
jgi:hypothetical protein